MYNSNYKFIVPFLLKKRTISIFTLWPILSGLHNICQIVQNGYTVLRVELKAGDETAFAEYSSFYIAGEEDKYKIHLSGYSGTAGYP